MLLKLTQQRLFNLKLAASGVKDFLRCVCVDELKAVAKGASLPHQGISHYPAERKREIQFHNLAHGNFKFQQG